MKLEDILNDKSTGFDRKIPTLITVWLRVKELLRNSQSKCLDRVIEWAQSHTLNLVLHGDWTSQSEELKEKLCKVVEEFDNALVEYENLSSRRCKKLIDVIRDPWGDTTLCKILNNPDKCTKEEELAYFSSEHGYLVAMRLKKLCDSHCEDLALRFANACLRCLRMPESQNFLVVTTEDQKRYILDIYIALLHKYKRTHDIINELKHLSLEEGLQLVQRFTNKRVELSRVWKHCSRIAELAAQFFMTAAMTKPINEIKNVLAELLNAWVLLNDKLEGLFTIPKIMRKIIQTADSAAHIYICCEVLNKRFGDKIKLFTIELYVRALTTDMNEMEKQKTRSELEKVDETSKRLSEGFLSLADLLQDHLGVSRECVLTSFSLNPTRSCMERIEKLAISCGKVPNPECSSMDVKEANDSAYCSSQESINLTPSDSSLPLLDTGQNNTSTWNKSPIKERSSLDALILIKGDAVTGSKNYDVLSAPNQVLDAEELGLSEQLCDDLAVVLSSPRYQMLSWVLDWNELKSTCDRYLSNAEGTRNTVKELKYLNIDYNQFKDWPSDEERQQYGGIEKGYEQWAEAENSNSVPEYPLIYSQSNDSDSNCSTSTGRGRRRRKTTQRIYSSESEYESVERKVDSHGSDIDTASQDADSLGSDALLHISKKSKKNPNTNLPHFAVIMNKHNQSDSVSNFGSDEMLSIFARLETPDKTLTVSKPSYVNPNLQPFMLPEKRSSDPQVLRNLRMYRTKKRLTDLGNINSLKNEDNLNLKNEDKLNLKNEDKLNLKNEDKLNLKNENELNLRNESELNLKNGNELKSKIGNELNIKNDNELNLKDKIELNLKDKIELNLKEKIELNLKEKIELNLKEKIELNLKDKIELNLKEKIELNLKEKIELNLKNGNELNLKNGNELNLKNAKELNLKNGKELNLKNGNELNSKNGNDLNSTEKLAKLKDMPHMNPRVILDRHDFNNFVSKNLLKTTVKQEIDNLVNKRHLETEQKSFSKNNFNNINMNPRVLLNRYEDLKSLYKTSKHDLRKASNQDLKNFYKTNRYDLKKASLSNAIADRKKRKLDLLDNVPGMNSLDMIQPAIIQPTVQVVQLTTNQITSQQMRTVKTSTSSSNVTSTISSSITSTPVTAHIQRVGQPRPQDVKVTRTEETARDNTCTPASVSNAVNNNSDIQVSSNPIVTTVNVIVSDSSSSSASKPVVTQSSQPTPTLVNILSQQIIRPGQANTAINRSPTLINILSQQIIRPPLSQSVPIVCVSTSGLQNNIVSNTTSVTTTQAQNNLKLVTSSSSQHQILQQLFSSQGKNNNQVLKNVNLVTGLTNTQSSVDTSRLVQFLCKTDGKMIQLTPYSTNSNIKLQTFDSSKLVKTTTSTVSSNKQVTTQSVTSPISPPVSTRSGYEENYAKFIQIAGKNIPAKSVVKDNTTNNESSSNEPANSLPKFQQAFGKTVYQNNNTGDPAPTLSTIGINSTNTVSLHAATLTTTPTTFTSTSSNSITVCPQLTNLQLTSTSLIGKSNTLSNSAAPTAAVIPVVGTSKTAVAPLGVQAIQGGVIYTRQVPVSLAVSAGQTINLISNASVSQASVGRNQVFRITSASGDQMNLVKDTVIRSKMSALLAAALQSGVPNRCVSSSATTTTTAVSSMSPSTDSNSTVTFTQNQQQDTVESEICEVDSSSNDSCHTSASTNTTSTLVTPMRITLPMMQRTSGPNGMQGARVMRPVLQIPSTMIRSTTAVRQQVVLASAQAVPIGTTSTGTSQTQSITIGDNIMSHNSMEPSVSSTTLEQLREFDLVLEQVKERSTVQPISSQTTIRTQVQAEKPTTNTNQTSSSSSDLQEVISGVQYISQGQITQKVSPCTSVVVVTSYCNIQPAASPALSVTSQSSSSPCVTPAPSSSGSIGKTVPKASAKSPKSKTVKTTTTHTSKASPVPKPQQKPQEDEQTTQRIFDILAEYAEQLRNSPDLNNKPAPRRRSNPPTNPSQNSKRKKNSGAKKTVSSHCNSMASDLSPGADDPRTIGSEDSSCGVVQISVQDSPSQGAPSTEDHQSTQGSSDFSSLRTQQNESSDATTEVIENQLPTSGRQFIFTDSNTNQSRNVIIADSSVNEALGKISNTAAVIVPANYIAVVSGNSKILATVPARSGSNMLLFQSFVNQARKPIAGQANVKSVKYSAIQPIQGISSQTLTNVNNQSSVVLTSSTDPGTLAQTLTLKKSNSENSTVSENETISATNELLLNIASSREIRPISSQNSEVTLGNIIKTEEIPHSESPIPSHLIKTENEVELDQSIKVQIEDHEIDIKIEEKPETLGSNTSFSLSFTTNTKSPPAVSVIEKNTISIQESSSPKKMVNTCLPVLGDKHHTVVRTVIENQSTAKSIATSSNIPFSQIESVDHFTKVYTGEKKSQTNTNGPMLGQTEAAVNRDVIVTDSGKENVHGKEDSTAMSAPYSKPKKLQTTQRTEKELQQVQQRKQAAVERELQLQKSLSEECEDLGVDEPSTSDLFPEADLLFDSNNSPSFDQLSQDADKRYTTGNFPIESPSSSTDEDYKKTPDSKEANSFLAKPHGSNSSKIKKEESDIANKSCKVEGLSTSTEKHDTEHKSSETIRNLASIQKEKEPTITLFSDEDNSSSTLRTDLLFENLGYPSGEVEFDYDERPKMRQITNCSKDGITLQSNTSLSVSSYDEHTLLTTCASIMEVCSPIHYDIHSDSPPPIHKYKFKYCNRKKLMNMNMQNNLPSKSSEKMDNSWHHNTDVVEIVSSDDVSSDSATTERVKSSTSGSPSPTSSIRKRSSPAWDEEDDEHDDEDSNSPTYKTIYNANKILKLSVEKLVEPITCANQQKSSNKVRKNSVTECTLDSSVVNSTPSSPLSPSDGELGSFNIGRGTRRSTQRLKKNCPCCTPQEKTPRKRTTSGSNIKKLAAKGQFAKKR